MISLSQWTGACWEFALEPIKLLFTLSGVCSQGEANYRSNPFEVLIIKFSWFLKFWFCLFINNNSCYNRSIENVCLVLAGKCVNCDYLVEFLSYLKYEIMETAEFINEIEIDVYETEFWFGSLVYGIYVAFL